MILRAIALGMMYSERTLCGLETRANNSMSPMESTLGLGYIIVRDSGVWVSTHCILLDAGASATGTVDLSTYNYSHKPGQEESASMPMLCLAV